MASWCAMLPKLPVRDNCAAMPPLLCSMVEASLVASVAPGCA
jgi:hypothetical protein